MKTQLDDYASSSGDNYVDADALNEELSIVCEKLLEKYKTLKKKSFGLNKENKDLISKHDLADADALNEELSIICEKLLEKYKALKKKFWT